MRTDVKLSVAIVGALCLLVIAYVTFRSPPSDGEVRLIVDEEGTSAEMPEEPSAGSRADGRVAERGPARPESDGAEVEGASTDRGATRSAGAGASNGGVNWARLLESGTPLMSAGPARPDPNVSYMFGSAEAEREDSAASEGRSAERPGGSGAAEAPWADEVEQAPALAYVPPQVPAVTEAAGNDAAVTEPRTRQAETESASAGARTHTVRERDTMSSIAAEVYGSASYYPHIMRANPEVDPNRLRPGTVLNLPDESAVRPEAAPSRADREASIDARREYRVEENDSLYRISMKLYGRGDQVDAIYELNREEIGSNPDRLRLNMVLKLPEPPTAAGASARTSAQ